MQNFRHFENGQPVELNLSFHNRKFLVRKASLSQTYLIRERAGLFGFVYDGEVTLLHGSNKIVLGEGMHFAVNSEWQIDIRGGVFLVECEDFRPMNIFGGPVEEIGRLKYIDDCTDSLIIPPVKLGDPCLNILFFPPRIRQTMHTHPSFRVGMVLSGGGRCVMSDQSKPLNIHDTFYIPENEKHCFHSDENSGLVVLAFHPDSDYGPTDQIHPMINRTIL